MLFATREILLDKLLSLPALIDTYQRGDSDFVLLANTWLQELEQSLAQLRSPLTSLVARERARVISAQDGLRDPSISEKVSRRRAVKMTTSLALGQVEAAMAGQLQTIDQKFDVWRDKLAQFISVASGLVPIPLPPSEPRREWLQLIWASWKQVEEARAMYNYLNTIMAPGDRLQLLGELLENNLNGNGH